MGIWRLSYDPGKRRKEGERMIKTSEGTIIDVQRTIFGMVMIKAIFLNGGNTLILTDEEFREFKKMLENVPEESE